jgi:hypothetical protein
MNGQNSWDDWCDAIDKVIAETGIQSRADAAEIARRRYPHLACVKAPGSAGATGGRTSPPAAAQNPEAELDRLARQHQREHPGSTYAQAFCAILNSDPRLYVDYLRQKAREVAATPGGGRG